MTLEFVIEKGKILIHSSSQNRLGYIYIIYNITIYIAIYSNKL